MSLAENEPMGVQGGMMAGVTGYAQPLRAIGQALEILNIQGFEMKPAGDDFLLRGSVLSAGEPLASAQSGPGEMRTLIWGHVPESVETSRGKYDFNRPDVVSEIELHYTLQDVERFEKEGRERRGKSEKDADAPSLSQALRCIGEYLNQKRARLVKVARESESLTVEYETSLGSQLRESFTVKDIYDLWVRMYLQRTGRTSH